jgi:hypothetical protein
MLTPKYHTHNLWSVWCRNNGVAFSQKKLSEKQVQRVDVWMGFLTNWNLVTNVNNIETGAYKEQADMKRRIKRCGRWTRILRSDKEEVFTIVITQQWTCSEDNQVNAVFCNGGFFVWLGVKPFVIHFSCDLLSFVWFYHVLTQLKDNWIWNSSS